jgi:hypothetical protein
MECTPGLDFNLGCNQCSCSLDGKTAACTKMMCIDYESEDLIKRFYSDFKMRTRRSEKSYRTLLRTI